MGRQHADTGSHRGPFSPSRHLVRQFDAGVGEMTSQVLVHVRAIGFVQQLAIPLGIGGFTEIIGTIDGLVIIPKQDDGHRRLQVLCIVFTILERIVVLPP